MPIDRRTLFDRLAGFPRLGLANLPTPLEPMKRLTAHLGGPRLWVKREDAIGLGFGGNKLRKLDYVLHDALSKGADTIVSGGVVQSNSQRQVAAVAAKLGLACHLAVYHGRLEPRPRNTRLPAMRFSIGCSARTFMMCRGPATAMPPFARSSAILKPRGTGRTSCLMAFRMRWAPSLMPRRFRRSKHRPHNWGSHPAPSCTVLEARARRLVLWSVLPSQCQAYASSGLISMPNRRGCEPMSLGLRRKPPSCLM